MSVYECFRADVALLESLYATGLDAILCLGTY